MIFVLLVVLAVSIAFVIHIDKRAFANRRYDPMRLIGVTGRVLLPADNKPMTNHQLECRKLFQNVIYLWRFGYLPPRDMTLSQRVVFGFFNTVLIAGTLIVLWLMLLEAYRWIR